MSTFQWDRSKVNLEGPSGSFQPLVVAHESLELLDSQITFASNGHFLRQTTPPCVIHRYQRTASGAAEPTFTSDAKFKLNSSTDPTLCFQAKYRKKRSVSDAQPSSLKATFKVNNLIQAALNETEILPNGKQKDGKEFEGWSILVQLEPCSGLESESNLVKATCQLFLSFKNSRSPSSNEEVLFTTSEKPELAMLPGTIKGNNIFDN